MQTHGSGPIRGTRPGAYGFNHSALIEATVNLSGVSKKLFTIDATTQNPVAYRTRVVIDVANNAATTATLAIGTSSGGAQVLAASDIKQTAGINIAPAATAEIRIATSATEIFATATYVGTPTLGRAYVLIEMWDLNINLTTDQGD